MNPIIRNIFAVIAGIVVGMIVNMGIITVSGSIIPPPDGMDLTTTEGLKASMHLLQPKHFILPFLAHALGTFAGAFAAASFAANRNMRFAIGIGVFFLVAGISNVFMLPSPTWFNIVDLVGAYIPMAYIAGKMAINRVKKINPEGL